MGDPACPYAILQLLESAAFYIGIVMMAAGGIGMTWAFCDSCVRWYKDLWRDP